MTGLAGVGIRLYDSPTRAELYGYRLRTTSPNCRSSSSAAFRAQLTGERDRPLCSNETSDLRQNWTLCDHRTSPFRITFELLRGTTRVFTHACIWQVEHASSPPSPNMGSMPGTTSSYHDVIIWGHLFVFHVRDKGNFQCFMNVEDCVISKI